MKKKNILWSLLAMMVLALGASFVACGSDDDDDDDGLLGTWVGKDGSITLTLKIESGGTEDIRDRHLS